MDVVDCLGLLEMFVTFEGIDGAGTSTHSRLVASWLESMDVPVLLTAEPSTGPIGRLIRAALAGDAGFPPDGVLMSYLFAADRKEHLLREIEPALNDGKWVLCDRYQHSTIAYQGVDVDSDWLESVLRPLRMPDVVVFLEIDVDLAIERLKERGRKFDVYESRRFLQRVADKYMNIFDASGSYLLIRQNTDAPMDLVQESIRKALLPLLQKDSGV